MEKFPILYVDDEEHNLISKGLATYAIVKKDKLWESKNQFKFKNKPIPIFNPILQYSKKLHANS